MTSIKIGFLGAGGIARAHAYALNSLKYYYNNVPSFQLQSVASARKESREAFAKNYEFLTAESPDDFFINPEINSVLILGPNNTHYQHFKKALQMPSIKSIYIEKPICASHDEEKLMWKLLQETDPSVKIQVGFQYPQTSSVREMLKFWKSGILGKPIHFDLKYYHGDYLQHSYRDKRQTRLTPAPDGGAMADLGSHGISLLMVFLGEELQIMGALQGGSFPDVPVGSDLFSSLSLFDPATKAVGNLSASRISSGSGDLIFLEIYAEKGTLRFSSHRSDRFEYFLEETRQWITQVVGSNYNSVTSFPSGHVHPGWLRSMVHSHYVFLGGRDESAFIPGLAHGLSVQRIVRETAEYLNKFRKEIKKYEQK